MPTRILTVDDHDINHLVITSLLAAHPDMEIIGQAHDGIAAITQAERLRPDVIIMDVSMPHMNGVDATRVITERGLPCRIIIRTTTDSAQLDDAHAAGAIGFVYKGKDHELLAALRATIQETPWHSWGQSPPTVPAQPIRVLIVHRHSGVREQLRARISHDSLLMTVGEARLAADALAQAPLVRPDIVILGADLDDMEPVTFINCYVEAGLPGQIVLWDADNPTVIERARQAGAVAVVPDGPSDSILAALKKAANPTPTPQQTSQTIATLPQQTTRRILPIVLVSAAIFLVLAWLVNSTSEVWGAILSGAAIIAFLIGAWLINREHLTKS